jgi:hypothetical protein
MSSNHTGHTKGPNANGAGRLAIDEDDVTPTFAAMLLEASGRVPDDQVDWAAFHSDLATRAELALARLRYPAVAAVATATSRRSIVRALPLRTTYAWWEPAARWGRLSIAASVAAGIALTVVVHMSPKEPDTKEPGTVVASSVGSATSGEALAGRRAAFESVVSGRTTSPTVESALLPTVTDLLIPLGKGAPVP